MTETDEQTGNDERTKENQPEDMRATGPGSGPALPVWAAGLAAGGAAFASNLLIAAIARTALNAPRTFAPLTVLPLVTGSIGGVVGATSVYALLCRLFRRPMTPIFAVTGVVLLASVSLPMRLFRSRSPRFAGMTPALGVTLVSLHTVVALCSLYAVRCWREKT